MAAIADAKPDLASHPMVDASNSNKRKRSSHDQGPANRRSPVDAGRGFTRSSPSSANNVVGSSDLSDQAAQFLSEHNAGGAGDESSIDFNSLTQSGGDHSFHQNGDSNPSNAGNTAAAALTHFSMTVPQPTEMSFQSQTSGGESLFLLVICCYSAIDGGSDTRTDFSGLEALKSNNSQQNSAQNDNPTQPSSQKLVVGSEEWHKVRRDNHKEGK